MNYTILNLLLFSVTLAAYLYWTLYRNTQISFDNKIWNTYKSFNTLYNTSEYNTPIVIASIFFGLIVLNGFGNPALSYLGGISFLVGISFSAAMYSVSNQLFFRYLKKTIASNSISNEAVTSDIQKYSFISSFLVVPATIIPITLLYMVWNFVFPETESIKIVHVTTPVLVAQLLYTLYLRGRSSLLSDASEMSIEQTQQNELSVPRSFPYHHAVSLNTISKIQTKFASAIVNKQLVISIVSIAAILSGTALNANVDSDQETIIDFAVLPMFLITLSTLAAYLVKQYIEEKNSKPTLKNTSKPLIAFSISTILIAYFIVKTLLPSNWDVRIVNQLEKVTYGYSYLGVFWTFVFGFLAGIGTYVLVKYWYSEKISNVNQNEILKKSANQNFLSGMENSYGVLIPFALMVVILFSASYYFAGIYGITIGIAGMIASSEIAFPELLAQKMQKFLLDEKLIYTTNESSILTNSDRLPVTEAILYTICAIDLFFAVLLAAGIQEAGIDIAKPAVILSLLGGAAIPFVMIALYSNFIKSLSNTLANETLSEINNVPELKTALGIFTKYPSSLEIPYEENNLILHAETFTDKKHYFNLASRKALLKMTIPASAVLVIIAICSFFAGREILCSFVSGMLFVGSLLGFVLTAEGAMRQKNQSDELLQSSSNQEIEQGRKYYLTFAYQIFLFILFTLSIVLVLAPRIA